MSHFRLHGRNPTHDVRQLRVSDPAVPAAPCCQRCFSMPLGQRGGRREARGNRQQKEEGASPSPSARLTGTAGIVSAEARAEATLH